MKASQQLRLPREFSKKTVDYQQSSVTAKINMNNYGMCPVCNNPMRRSSANGHDVLVCGADRTVLPVKD